jgi:DNA-binding SARP family transcriptional activator
LVRSDTVSPLELRFLGALNVSIAGARVELPLRLRWVLARAALERGPIRRASLAQTFWNKGGSQSLRQALYALRALPASDRWLTITREHVEVSACCDVLSFYDLVDRECFSAALELGPLRLFDESMVERTVETGLWLDAERSRFEAYARRCLLGAARSYIDRNDPSAALACVDRALAIDPLDEPVAREGMRACALRGDLRGALDRYERLRRALLDSHGVEPTEQTDAFADELSRELRSSASHRTREAVTAPASACLLAIDRRAVALVEGGDPMQRVALVRSIAAERATLTLSAARATPGAYASALRWLGSPELRSIVGAPSDAADVLRERSDARRLRAEMSARLRALLRDRVACVEDLNALDPHSALALIGALDAPPLGAVLCGSLDSLDAAVRDALVARSFVRVQLAVVHARPLDGAAVLAGLSRSARRLAQWLAIEDCSDDALIAAVLDLDGAERDDAFDELERCSVVARRSIVTPTLRDELRASLSESVELGWRKRAALWFESTDQHARAAQHWDACGERSRAVDGWIAHARTLVALYDHEGARAVIAHVAERQASARQRFELASLSERCSALAGNTAQRAASLDAMDASARELQTDEALLEASLRRVAFARSTGRYQDVLVACDEIEGDARRAGMEAAWLRARSERAVALLRTGSVDEAERVFAELAATSDDAAIAVGEYGLGAVAGYRLNLEEARRRHERVLTAARSRGDLGMVARALNGLAATAERAGQRRRAAERFAEAASLARSVGDHEASRVAEVNAALAWVFGGRPAKALALLDARPEGRAQLRPEALEEHARAVMYLEFGALDEARTAFDRTIALADAGHDARRASHARLDRAFTEKRWEQCVSAVERELNGELTRDVASLTWLELALVAPTAADSRALIARAGTTLGPVASLLASLARLRLGEDDGQSLNGALGEVETMFTVLGWRLCAVRRRGAAQREARARFEEAFEEAACGLDRALAARWLRWIEVRSSADLGAPWARSVRDRDA